ncbi:MFS transporter [Paractinoplanes rishiriensis]|uniref:MFS transporter n=1 Tax=Paractinoplanes rishiriensis TaxID=1050105 RepID=UPI0023B3334E|nr:MFS transporter [Actinoplanes rishiriensis]
MVATAFLTMLDNTVVTVAAPSIASDLGASVRSLEWVATAYMLPYAGLLLAGGRLADRYGDRRILLGGLAVFTAASLAAGLAGHLAVLVAARAVQGAGAALLVPATLAVVAGRPERERLRAAAAWTAAGAVALAAGPVVGGVLSEHLHWSWIFLLNVPVGVAALAVAARAVDPARRPGPPALGLTALVAATVALAAVTYVLTGGPAVPAALAVAAAAAVLTVRTAGQVFDAALFAERAYRGALAVQVLWGLAVTGVCFHTAVFLQDVRGFGPVDAGLAFVAVAAAVAVGAPVAPLLVRRRGAARTVTWGLILVGLGVAAVAAGSTRTVVLLAAFVVIGFGSALTVPLAAVALAAVPADRSGLGSGVFAVAREVSGVLGIAGLGVIVLGWGYPAGLTAAAVLVLGGAVISSRTLPGAERPQQRRPGGVQFPLPVRPGVRPVRVQVDGGRDAGE